MRQRFLLLLLLLFLFIHANAQVKITPEIGTTVSKCNLYNAGVGLRIGANIRYSFSGEDIGFGIHSGLFYTQHKTTSFSGGEILYSLPGSNQSHSLLLFPESTKKGDIGILPNDAQVQRFKTYYIKTRKDYLQIPILAEYSWRLSSILRYYIAAGPYVAIGVSGVDKNYTSSCEYNKSPIYNTTTEKAFNDNFSNRFDAGASVQTGIQIDKISVNINYDVNLYKRNLYGKGHFVSIGLGYTI